MWGGELLEKQEARQIGYDKFEFYGEVRCGTIRTCEKPPSELKLPRGLPKAIVAVESRLADVMRRVCSGLAFSGRGLLPFELRRVNIEKRLPDDCESGVRGDLVSLQK